MLKCFFGLDLNQEGEASTVGAFSQNSMSLNGLPMISFSESDLIYPLCGLSYHVLLSARRGFSLKMVSHCMQA